MWRGEASFVAVPADEGEMGFLPGRQPVLAVLQPGIVRIIPADGGETLRFEIEGGFVSVDVDVEIVVSDTETIASQAEFLVSELAD